MGKTWLTLLTVPHPPVAHRRLGVDVLVVGVHPANDGEMAPIPGACRDRDGRRDRHRRRRQVVEPVASDTSRLEGGRSSPRRRRTSIEFGINAPEPPLIRGSGTQKPPTPKKRRLPTACRLVEDKSVVQVVDGALKAAVAFVISASMRRRRGTHTPKKRRLPTVVWSKINPSALNSAILARANTVACWLTFSWAIPW